MRSCFALCSLDAQTHIVYISTNICIANCKIRVEVGTACFLTSVPVEPSRQDDLSALPSPTEALIIHPGPGDVQGGHEVLLRTLPQGPLRQIFELSRRLSLGQAQTMRTCLERRTPYGAITRSNGTGTEPGPRFQMYAASPVVGGRITFG